MAVVLILSQYTKMQWQNKKACKCHRQCIPGTVLRLGEYIKLCMVALTLQSHHISVSSNIKLTYIITTTSRTFQFVDKTNVEAYDNLTFDPYTLNKVNIELIKSYKFQCSIIPPTQVSRAVTEHCMILAHFGDQWSISNLSADNQIIMQVKVLKVNMHTAKFSRKW